MRVNEMKCLKWDVSGFFSQRTALNTAMKIWQIVMEQVLNDEPVPCVSSSNPAA